MVLGRELQARLLRPQPQETTLPRCAPGPKSLRSVHYRVLSPSQQLFNPWRFGVGVVEGCLLYAASPEAPSPGRGVRAAGAHWTRFGQLGLLVLLHHLRTPEGN